MAKPEELASELSKTKMTLKDGLVSTGLIFLIVGILLSIITFAFLEWQPILKLVLPILLQLFLGTSDTNVLYGLFVIGLPILGMIFFAVFAGVYRLVANKLGGKSSFNDASGALGLIGGTYFLATIPGMVLLIAGFAVRYLYKSDIGYYVLYALGTISMAALAQMVTGVMFSILSFKEKTSLPKTGLIIGIATSILTVAIVIAIDAWTQSSFGTLTGLGTGF